MPALVFAANTNAPAIRATASTVVRPGGFGAATFTRLRRYDNHGHRDGGGSCRHARPADEPIEIGYIEADIQNVLRTLAAKANVNLILGDEVARQGHE